VGSNGAAHLRCVLTRPNLFPVGRQKLFRRPAAVLGASLNDNCPFGREGGSHRAIKHGVKDIERSEARCRVRGKTVARRRIAIINHHPVEVLTDVASADVPVRTTPAGWQDLTQIK